MLKHSPVLCGEDGKSPVSGNPLLHVIQFNCSKNMHSLCDLEQQEVKNNLNSLFLTVYELIC